MVWVRPGVLLVKESRLRPVSALMALDLPTLERPAKTISGTRGDGKSAGLPAEARNCAWENRCMARKAVNSNKITPFRSGAKNNESNARARRRAGFRWHCVRAAVGQA